MDAFAMLRQASAEWLRRIDLVRPDHLELPTPCPEWSVGDLVGHVISADHAYVALLGGGDAEQFVSIVDNFVLPADLAGAARESASAVIASFEAPGTLDLSVAHPVGEIPARRLMSMRTTDWLVHSWDLAHALGTDKSFDGMLAEALYADLLPRAAALVGSGYFKPGVGTPDDAPAQARLLDLVGRTP